ncbi:pentapeptide repeat-containing protein [Argonema antarcticum]|uniref:pentapeptide repeat-containing protein n=1 Tax=Argonema antarcticum TaxID=2942763 RepID=UPI00201199F7|nr:pentapeptide repeat-containing protein [Argonema antarcticum]MCL1471169.1 pentapeptide repeat-containing protein [Argonema antarcticum A004/B2]
MTVDEALAIAETVLDGECLNDVEYLIFRQCWQGRCSYEEIAKLSKYDDEYIKSVAAKLWKQLSDAFEEKVKKNNLQSVFKRYLRRNQISLHRTQEIEVNLSGANLSGATLNLASLSGTRLLFTNFSEAVSCQEDLEQALLPDSNTNSPEEIIESEEEDNQQTHSNSQEKIYLWNDLHFYYEEQIKIAEALDRANIFFFPNAKARLTTPEGRQNQEPNFLIFHQGKWGILELSHPDRAKAEERVAKRVARHRLFETHGIRIIHYCDCNRCNEEPDRVVQEFLEILGQE